MTDTSDKFEKQIQRIHDLIEETGAKVTWNDRIPDPDNPDQSRQIDVSIKKDGKLTLVECRIHKQRQDVKWIEELIGRRHSLKASAIIAVSASGFTKGAIAKAEAHGVILRDILSLTEEEIRQWGNKTRIWITFYEYSKVDVVFVFSKLIEANIRLDDIKSYLSKNTDKFYSFFDAVAKAIDENKLATQSSTVSATIIPEGMSINGFTPKSVLFKAKIRVRKRQLQTPSVVVYDNPKIGALERNVFVETVELGEFEITQSSNRVMVTLDLSTLQIPPNCQLRFVTFDFQRIVTMTGMRVLPLPQLRIPIQQILIGIQYIY